MKKLADVKPTIPSKIQPNLTMSSPLQDLMLNDRGFAFDPTGGETFQLSPTALRIVRLLQQGAEQDSILPQIIEEFDVEPNTASRDFGDFMQSLKQLGWLTA
jgi:Coenzyme PQQ synthesis protein D (PqqD)